MSHTQNVDTERLDREMMSRCIEVAVRSGKDGEYPYGALICRAGKTVAESTNRVAHERDVTRHAEIVVISLAQKMLDTISLDDCTLYSTSEPCVCCSYAVRESRIRRVVYALHAPHTGGLSRWNILADENLTKAMPEVFNPPPEVIGGFMADETEQALLDWNPVIWGFIRQRGLFIAGPAAQRATPRSHGGSSRIVRGVMRLLRRLIFDRFGRRI